MRISDWSTDVCSSDLKSIKHAPKEQAAERIRRTVTTTACAPGLVTIATQAAPIPLPPVQPAMPAEFPFTSSGGGVPVVIGGSGGWGGSGGCVGGFFGGGGSGGGGGVVFSPTSERQRGGEGKKVAVSVDMWGGGSRINKKQT